MAKVAIVTDSTVNLPQSIIKGVFHNSCLTARDLG